MINRTPSTTHQWVFIAKFTDVIWEMVMNAFLYFPLGLGLSVLIGKKSILAALVLSLSIETWQYLMGTGLAQGTDIIMNTLGCVIGCVPWMIYIHAKTKTD